MNDQVGKTENRIVLLKASEVAEILNIGVSKAYQLMQKGEIPTVRIDHSVRVRPNDLDEYIQKCWTGWKDQKSS